MRKFGVVAPQFWTGETGKALRGEPHHVRILAIYLMTSPHANMIGLYYLPWVLVGHETGLTIEESTEGMKALDNLGFAKYDETTEMVWIPKMAKYQIGESIKPSDNTRKTIQNMLLALPNNPFIANFCTLYADNYHLELHRTTRLSTIGEGSKTPLGGVYPDPAPDPSPGPVPDPRKDHRDLNRLVEHLQYQNKGRLRSIIGGSVPRDYLNRLLQEFPFDRIGAVAEDLATTIASYRTIPDAPTLRKWLHERCTRWNPNPEPRRGDRQSKADADNNRRGVKISTNVTEYPDAFPD